MISIAIEGILGFILELLFRILIELICFYTGEGILYLLTLGRKKVRWGFYSEESISKTMLLVDRSTIIGLLFWFALLVFIFQKIL